MNNFNTNRIKKNYRLFYRLTMLILFFTFIFQGYIQLFLGYETNFIGVFELTGVFIVYAITSIVFLILYRKRKEQEDGENI